MYINHDRNWKSWKTNFLNVCGLAYADTDHSLVLDSFFLETNGVTCCFEGNLTKGCRLER